MSVRQNNRRAFLMDKMEYSLQQRARSRLWKWALQRLAYDFDLWLWVCHFSLGTSKWDKIEHCVFSCISENWRRKPLISHQAIVNLIAVTTTRTGLHVKAALDTPQKRLSFRCPMSCSRDCGSRRTRFTRDWNYTIAQRH